jgi:regulator of protease activity HflC (stomatin/prohibitin superfamily)
VSSLVVVLIVIGVLVLVGFAAVTVVTVLQEYERGVIFRLGRVLPRPKGPGLILRLPFGIDRMRKVTLQTVAMNVPPQDIITRDNMIIRVDVVVYLRVVDPVKAVVEILNYLFATSQVTQTNLRVVLGKKTLNEVLSDREGDQRRADDGDRRRDRTMGRPHHLGRDQGRRPARGVAAGPLFGGA